MKLASFIGGIHPKEGKDLSKDKPILPILPGKEMVYLLSQHIGAPAKAIVKKGDRVLVGQQIAQANGFVSSPVYSTVSGLVKGLEKRLSVVGTMQDAIIVENDELYEEVDYEPLKNPKEVSKEEILKRIAKAGVVGMGGAGFPTHVKLSPKEPEKIDYVIVNGAECEPYLTSDYRRMLEEPEKIIEGLKYILMLFDNAKGYIAIENNKPDCIAKIKELVKNEDRIEVKALKTKYPQGAERQLIYATTKRLINSSMLPADAGCVVDNVDTVVAVYHAVCLGRPLMHRIVTVTGDAIKEARNFLVPVGSNYKDLISQAGGFIKEAKKIVSGGPMMGFALFDLDLPVTKTSSALLCFSEDEVSKEEESNCINCGQCVKVCPGRVVPARLAAYANRGDVENFEKYEGMECCECGCCSYVCPAKRQLTQSIKSMRKIILANRKKKA
ncbi:MAG TPA: electron transport complex subunit RsxC [Lachnospiraceae bacterium]